MRRLRDQQTVGIIACVAIILSIMATPVPAWAQKAEARIGYVIAAEGNVTITSEEAIPRPAALRQEVFMGDRIQTGPDSSLKILFDDNTQLSVSADSEIQVTEFLYDPRSVQRTTILDLTLGRVKAIISDFYGKTDSRFEIRTPAGVAAARGTEYVVWTAVENGVNVVGVAVLSGNVSVTNVLGQSTTLSAGQFTVGSRLSPPAPPAPISGNPQVEAQVEAAEVKTDSTVVSQVTVQVARQEQSQKQAIATAAPAAATTVTQAIVATSQTAQSGGAGGNFEPRTGETTLDGETEIPCTIITPGGRLPVGCTDTGQQQQ